MQSKGKKLMLSSDIAKTRLKWTPELHKRFVDAVNQLGGSEKATPKSIKRVMGIHGITLYHLKSHLQKYRLVKNQQSQTCNETQQEEKREFKRNQLIEEAFQEKKNSHIALQVQMKIERKLCEQIEVQRHLKLRVEAQGKYLQIILQKARESLSRYNESGHRISQAKQEPSLPVSVVDNGYTSSLSALTEFKESGSILKIPHNKLSRTSNGSLESSLTSSETAETDDWTMKSSMEQVVNDMTKSGRDFKQ